MQLSTIVLCHSCSASFREVFKNVNKFRLLLVHHGGDEGEPKILPPKLALSLVRSMP